MSEHYVEVWRRLKNLSEHEIIAIIKEAEWVLGDVRADRKTPGGG
jgi:hypothetical protein